MLCREHGVAYQADREHLVAYDAEYYDRCSSYEGQEIANRINAGRIALVEKHYGSELVVDIGVGSGEFIKRRGNTFGHDVNPVAIEWLKRNGLWADRLDEFCAFTMWDVVEHLETPEEILRHVPVYGWVFFSLPIFPHLGCIRQSRHYRPGEHLTYWTAEGFITWIRQHGFLCRDHQTFEIEAGRDSIHSFACKRYGPAA